MSLRQAAASPRWLATALLLGAAAATQAVAEKRKVIACTQQQGRPVVVYEGAVAEDDGAIVRRAFASCFGGGRGPAVIDLRSDGGSVIGGFDVANFLLGWNRQHGPVTTRVSAGHQCISACTFIFSAGAFREVQSGASFEPHGFSAYSGMRLDRAMRELFEKHASQPARAPLQHTRLGFMSRVLVPAAAADGRLQWMVDFLRPWNERLTVQGLTAAAQRWIQLTPAQQLALARLDSVTHLLITELERATALQVLQRHLDRLHLRSPAAGAAQGPGADDDAAQLARMYRNVLNLWIKDAGAGAPLPDLGAGEAVVRQAMTERAAAAQSAVDRQLWPFFEQRRDAIDIEGLMKLMFSTSIVYTRPLTREELCDLNVVNRDCD
jgi:hypothetical protein